MHSSPSKRFLISLFFAFSLLLSIVYIKVYLQARSEFQQAETLLKKTLLRRAIRHYSYTIKWYTPGNKYVIVAMSRIQRLSDHAYQQGNWSLATYGYQQLRDALKSIRSLYQPHQKILRFSQEKLAKLLTLLPGKNVSNPAHNEMISKKLLITLLDDPSPNFIYSFLSSLFFIFWFLQIGLLLTFWNKFPIQKPPKLAFISTLSSFILWLIFLSLA